MSVVADMLRLLDEERDALLSGNFDALDSLAMKKQELSEGLRDARPESRAELDALAKAMHRNGDLLDAAQRGIRQAQRQLREIRNGMAQATYGSDGNRTPMSKASPRLEQKY